MNVKEIEDEIKEVHDNSKNTFSLQEVIDLICRKWFVGKGRDAEAEEMFKLFDRKYLNLKIFKRDKNGVGL
jgi:hypothetical protein